VSTQPTKQTILGPKDSLPLLDAIKQHINLPDKLISLELRLGVDKCVTCKAEFYATQKESKAA
jgi:hypothetical protein